MGKQQTYLLYFFRITILVLTPWFIVACFSPAINKDEAAFQQSITQNQLTHNQLLSKSAKYNIDALVESTNRRPDDQILPNTYFLAEQQCTLALDTLSELFQNQNISNQELEQQVSTSMKYLHQNIWVILEKFEQENPIITEEEITDFYSKLYNPAYSINNQNRILIKSLVLGQIEQIKARFSRFVSGRMSGPNMIFDKFQPMVSTSTHKKNQPSSINIFLAVSDKTPYSKTLDINDTSIPFIHGIARYKTVFNDSLARQLIVKGKFKTQYEPSVVLQDTFNIYPTLKN